MSKLDAHLFICTNQKDGVECCAQKGAASLHAAVKEVCSNRPEWKGRVRINRAGCLGHCEKGIAAVLYPEGKWFHGLTEKDAARLVEAVEKAL